MYDQDNFSSFFCFSTLCSDKTLEELSTWDPASEAFQNKKFNSYLKPTVYENFLEDNTTQKGCIYSIISLHILDIQNYK